MSGNTAVRRVIVGFADSPAGRNALWWGVRRASSTGSVLFVVRAISTVPFPRAPWQPPALARSREEFAGTVADALLLAVGEPPAGLDIRTAVVCGALVAVLAELADRAEDVVFLARKPRSWPSAATVYCTRDAHRPPYPVRT